MPGKPTYAELEHRVRKLETDLQNSEQKFKALFEKGPIGVAYHKMVYDKSGNPKDYLFLEANKNYQMLTGVNPVGKFVTEAFPGIEDDPFDWIGKFGDVAKTGKELKVQQHLPLNDRWYDVVGYQYKPDHFVAAFLEITASKKAKEALYASERRFKALIKNSFDSIVILNKEGQQTYVSDAVEKHLGFKPHEVTNISVIDEMIHPDDQEKAIASLHKILNEGEGGVQYRHKHKNGAWVHLEAWGTNQLNNPDIQGVVINVRNITEWKKAEQEKKQAQQHAAEQKKMVLVGQIAGKMAHDFNNILAVIMGNAQIALVDSKDEKTRKILKIIFKQTLRGKNLTKNLVAFAKGHEPKQEYFRVNKKIDLVLDLLKKELAGISVIKEDQSIVPDLLADPGMIEHALVNLIQNSIHAISKSEYPQILIRTCFSDDTICIEIEDNGCGIPEEFLERIYEPSFTLKGSKDVTGSYKTGIRGTGYGMANVKKYIELHKGTISIKTGTGSGTLFTIRLPVIKKELTRVEKTILHKEITQYEKYILLVEDETAISDIQYKILTQNPCKHKVDIASNGQIAMDLFDRNTYDFISLDYILPGGINGMDVYHHIRETDKTIPILFISGNIEFLESIKELKLKDANIDHLSKPCQNKHYVNKINSLMEQSLPG